MYRITNNNENVYGSKCGLKRKYYYFENMFNNSKNINLVIDYGNNDIWINKVTKSK